MSPLRLNGDAPFITDEGNYILDLHLNRIGNARQFSLVINQIPGVVENGLFIDICDVVVIEAMATARSRCATSMPAPLKKTGLILSKSDNLFTDLSD